MSDLSVIFSELRELDYDAYLTAIFAPKKYCVAVSSIFLLQNQLKKIHELTNEDMVGLVRITWWREEITKIFSNENQQNHHLLNQIKNLNSKIDFWLLEQCFQGFEKDFSEEKNFRNLQELEDYIFQTGEIFYLTIMQLIAPKIAKDLQKKIAKNLALTDFYINLLREIKADDEKVLRFFASGLFSDLRFNLKAWKNNEDQENLKLIVKNIYLKAKLLSDETNSYFKQKTEAGEIKFLARKNKIAAIYLQNLHRAEFDIAKADLVMKRMDILRLLRTTY